MALSYLCPSVPSVDEFRPCSSPLQPSPANGFVRAGFIARPVDPRPEAPPESGSGLGFDWPETTLPLAVQRPVPGPGGGLAIGFDRAPAITSSGVITRFDLMSSMISPRWLRSRRMPGSAPGSRSFPARPHSSGTQGFWVRSRGFRVRIARGSGTSRPREIGFLRACFQRSAEAIPGLSPQPNYQGARGRPRRSEISPV